MERKLQEAENRIAELEQIAEHKKDGWSKEKNNMQQ